MENMDMVFIYFCLVAEEEQQALGKLKKVFGVGKVENEGHDQFGELLCYCVVPKCKIPKLIKIINKNSSNGEGLIYLEDIGLDSDSGWIDDFCIVEKPGISVSVPFEDWEEYIIYI
jgi:hypothetical protein